jgi:hypothetical protein
MGSSLQLLPVVAVVGSCNAMKFSSLAVAAVCLGAHADAFTSVNVPRFSARQVRVISDLCVLLIL